MDDVMDDVDAADRFLFTGLLAFVRIFNWSVDLFQTMKFYATVLLGVRASWDDLPSDLWGDIGKHLGNRLDILHFRSVCKKWRSSLPYPTRFPLMVPPPPQELCHVPYFITELNMCAVRCNKFPFLRPLLTAFEERSQRGIFRTHIEIDRPDLFNCPSRVSMENPPLTKLSFAAKAYYHRTYNFEENIFVRKTVIIYSDANSVNPCYASDLTVVAHLRKGKMKGRLALMRLRGSRLNWYWDTDFNTQVYEDIASYKGQLCTLDQRGRLFSMDYNSLQMTKVCDSSSVARKVVHKMLCQVSTGDLYLYDLSDLKYYKFSFPLRKWIRLKGRSDEIAWAGAYLIK